MLGLLTPLIMVIASIGLYFGYIDPTYSDIQMLQGRKQEFDSAIQNANQVTQKRDELMKKLNAFPKEDLDRLNKLIPDYVDNVRLIMEIDRIALKYGMTLRQVSTRTASESGDQNTSIGSSSKDYDKIFLSFTVTGTYPFFKKFLSELESNLRITDVNKVTFDTTVSNRGNDVYQYNVSLQTYWLK